MLCKKSCIHLGTFNSDLNMLPKSTIYSSTNIVVIRFHTLFKMEDTTVPGHYVKSYWALNWENRVESEIFLKDLKADLYCKFPLHF